VSFGHIFQRRGTGGLDTLQFDARVTASWDFRGFLLIKIDEFASGRFGDATFVAQRRVRHPTAKA